MKKLEKLYFILSNYLVAFFISIIGLDTLPNYLAPFWLLFNGYLWFVSPILIVLADRREKND